jgi:hypothetical protein
LVNTIEGPAKYIIFQYHAIINRNIVLNLYMVPNAGIIIDVYILTNIAILTNNSRGHHMAEMPDFGAATDGSTRVDNGSRMRKIISHKNDTPCLIVSSSGLFAIKLN